LKRRQRSQGTGPALNHDAGIVEWLGERAILQFWRGAVAFNVGIKTIVTFPCQNLLLKIIAQMLDKKKEADHITMQRYEMTW
jgi:hypothetical protein